LSLKNGVASALHGMQRTKKMQKIIIKTILVRLEGLGSKKPPANQSIHFLLHGILGACSLKPFSSMSITGESACRQST
jgi:hypothetical protein